jgi:hypothetical protein
MFASFQAAMAPGHNAGYQQGLYKRTYTGYFGGVPTWFATATLTSTNKIVGSINDAGVPVTTSYQFLGYFKAPYSETFTFTMNTDDEGFLWVGTNALAANFNAGNALITTNNTTVSNTVGLTAGQIYALRIQVGNNLGPGLISLTVSSPSLPVTSNLTSLSLYNPNTLGI